MRAFHFFSFQRFRDFLWCALFVLLLALSSPVSAETVTVDMAVSQGTPTYVGSGFMGSGDNGLTDSMLNPVKPRMLRCWKGCSNYPRWTALGAKAQYEIGMTTSAGVYAGENGDWSTWLNSITTSVNLAKTQGRTYQWEIANEPNYFMTVVDGRSTAQFKEIWRRGYIQIRTADPNAVILGPSSTFYPSSGAAWLKDFLLYAKTNNVLPNVLSWHEFDDGPTLTRDVADMRQWMAANGINIPRMSINEYVKETQKTQPGPVVGYLAALKRSNVESAVHACWPEADGTTWSCNNSTLNGLLTPTDKLPRAQWWVYKGYADMTGTLVGVTPGATVDAVAGRDSGLKTARIVLGRNVSSSTANTIEALVKNISTSAPYLINGGKVHVVAKRIPDQGFSALSSPLAAIDADYTVSNGQISISLANFYPHDAYTITLSAPGGMVADTTPPSVPGGLTATAASSSQINLSWSASTDNVGGIGLAGYKIYRNGSTTPVATTTGAATTYADNGLTASTTYSYTVAAYDAAGNTSAQSASVSKATPPAPTGDTTAPGIPGGLTASAASSSQINLSWTASLTTPAAAALRDTKFTATEPPRRPTRQRAQALHTRTPA